MAMKFCITPHIALSRVDCIEGRAASGRPQYTRYYNYLDCKKRNTRTARWYSVLDTRYNHLARPRS
jgi:hypothetical protein